MYPCFLILVYNTSAQLQTLENYHVTFRPVKLHTKAILTHMYTTVYMKRKQHWLIPLKLITLSCLDCMWLHFKSKATCKFKLILMTSNYNIHYNHLPLTYKTAIVILTSIKQ